MACRPHDAVGAGATTGLGFPFGTCLGRPLGLDLNLARFALAPSYSDDASCLFLALGSCFLCAQTLAESFVAGDWVILCHGASCAEVVFVCCRAMRRFAF